MPERSQSHQLISHYDPARLSACAAECTCGRWRYEITAGADPATGILQASVKAEREWNRHLRSVG